MAGIRFDRFITYTSAGSIDDYVQQYAGLGFVPLEQTVRHDPGLRNGFVVIGPEYLEFCWVEGEALFAAADAEEKQLRSAPRPFGLGMVADDVRAVHDEWTSRGYAVPEVLSGRPRDANADAPPTWSFQDIPNELLPGVSCFVLTYHRRRRDEVRRIKVAPNRVYAASGVTFVATEPEARATCWRDLRAPGAQIGQSETGFEVRIGPHQTTWMTSEDYQSANGLGWVPLPLPCGEPALLHLLATDVPAATTMMQQSGRRATRVCGREEGQWLITPDARDGFVFVIRQEPVEVWLRERIALTGERLELVQD